MSVVVISGIISQEQLEKAKEDYSDYIKVVVDIEKEILSAGGEWHADGEKVLLEMGSLQKNLWGGGIDIQTGDVDCISLINTRPDYNNSQEVADKEIRKKMLEVVNKVFAKYV